MTGTRHDAGNEKKEYRAKLGTFGFYNRGSNSSFWTPHIKGHWQIGAWLSLADWVHSLGSFICRMKQSWDEEPCLAHSQLHSGALLLTEHTLRLHNKYVWGEVNEMSAATVTHQTSLSPLHRTYLPSDWTVNFLLLSQSALRKDSSRLETWVTMTGASPLPEEHIHLSLVKEMSRIRGWRGAGVLTVNRSQVAPFTSLHHRPGFCNLGVTVCKRSGGVSVPFLSPDKWGNWGPQQENNSQLVTEEPDEIPAWSEQVEKNTQSLKWLPFPPPVLPNSGCFTSTNLLNSLSLTFLIWTVEK